MSWHTVPLPLFEQSFNIVKCTPPYREAFCNPHNKDTVQVAEHILAMKLTNYPFSSDVRLWCQLYLDFKTGRHSLSIEGINETLR